MSDNYLSAFYKNLKNNVEISDNSKKNSDFFSHKFCIS